MRHQLDVDRRTLESTNFAENALLGQTKLLVKLSQNQQITIQSNIGKKQRVNLFYFGVWNNVSVFHFEIIYSKVEAKVTFQNVK